MSVPIEQELKSQLDSVRVQVRPELAREAHRAFRRQRVRRRSAAAASTVIAVGTVATLVATGTVPLGIGGHDRPSNPTSPALPAGRIPPASLQPAPPSDGLSARQAATDILWMHSTGPAVSNTFAEGSFGVGSVFLTATDVFSPRLPEDGSATYRSITYGPDGKPADDSALAMIPFAGGQKSTSEDADYKVRAWTTGVDWSPRPASGGQAACTSVRQSGLAELDYGMDPAVAGTLLSCPAVTVTRGARIDGIGAIKLTDKRGGTLWINAVTDLPVKSMLPYVLYNPNVGIEPGGSKRSGILTTLYGYLAPSPSNVADLSASQPKGFRVQTIPPLGGLPTGKYVQPWVAPADVIPPFGLQPVPASDSLTSSQASKDVLWTHETTQATPASDSVIDNIFAYRTAQRDLTYTPSGQPWHDNTTYAKPGTAGQSVAVTTWLDYDNRTAIIRTSPGRIKSTPHSSTCATEQQGGSMGNINFASAPDAARGLLDCSGLTVTRGQTIDGMSAIKIASKHGETLWINATTYLPIELVVVNQAKPYPPDGYHQAPAHGYVFQYSWLPPTSANLAYLGVPIPAGFTRTQSASSSSVP
ncbi:MAG TPA: hypothetical protein VMU95_09835 [Trebonia sp.]|nr:hypothetical protein [Trebonia sp.]